MVLGIYAVDGNYIKSEQDFRAKNPQGLDLSDRNEHSIEYVLRNEFPTQVDKFKNLQIQIRVGAKNVLCATVIDIDSEIYQTALCQLENHDTSVLMPCLLTLESQCCNSNSDFILHFILKIKIDDESMEIDDEGNILDDCYVNRVYENVINYEVLSKNGFMCVIADNKTNMEDIKSDTDSSKLSEISFLQNCVNSKEDHNLKLYNDYNGSTLFSSMSNHKNSLSKQEVQWLSTRNTKNKDLNTTNKDLKNKSLNTTNKNLTHQDLNITNRNLKNKNLNATSKNLNTTSKNLNATKLPWNFSTNVNNAKKDISQTKKNNNHTLGNHTFGNHTLGNIKLFNSIYNKYILNNHKAWNVSGSEEKEVSTNNLKNSPSDTDSSNLQNYASSKEGSNSTLRNDYGSSTLVKSMFNSRNSSSEHRVRESFPHNATNKSQKQYQTLHSLKQKRNIHGKWNTVFLPRWNFSPHVEEKLYKSLYRGTYIDQNKTLASSASYFNNEPWRLSYHYKKEADGSQILGDYIDHKNLEKVINSKDGRYGLSTNRKSWDFSSSEKKRVSTKSLENSASAQTLSNKMLSAINTPVFRSSSTTKRH
jgi:hypothetical protein